MRIDIKDLNSLSADARVFHVKPKFMMNRTLSTVFILFNSMCVCVCVCVCKMLRVILLV